MNDTDRREFSRVDAFVCLQTRVVPEGQGPKLRSWVSSELALPQLQSLPELEDKAVFEAMNIINSKLDLILNILNHQDQNFHCLKTSQVNISGSGLSFDCLEAYEMGDMLELKIVFPEIPDMMICVYGQVVKTGNGESEGRRVSVRFSVIDEEIRDKIVKYVFDKQREIIRKSRRL